MANNIILVFLILSIVFDLRRNFSYSLAEKKNIKFVYRTIQDATVNQQSESTYFNKIIYISKANIAIVQDNRGFIIVFDSSQKNRIISQFFIFDCVSGIIVTSDVNKIICYSKQNFYIHQVLDIKKGSIELLMNYYEESSQIIQIQIDEQEEYLFLATIDGVIKIYKFDNVETLIEIQQYQYSKSSFVGFKISYNRNYIIIDQGYSGLHILKLFWDQDNTQQVYIMLAGSFISQTSYDSYLYKNEKIIISLDYWGGIQIGQIDILENTDPSQYPVQLSYFVEQWWEFDDPQPFCLAVNEEKKILFVGSRSQGIFIIDINDLQNPDLLQNIFIPSYAMSIQASSDVQYIYYTNRQSFFIFSQTQPYFQDDYLHFFNDHQSNLTDVHNIGLLWRCYVDSSDSILYSASDKNGLQIYDIKNGPNEMQLLFTINKNTEDLKIDDVVFLQDEKYIVIPVSSQNLQTVFRVYDIRNKSNIKEVSNVKYNKIRSVSLMRKSSNDRYIVTTFGQSILVLDCFDFLKEQEDKQNKEIIVVGEYEFFGVNKHISSDVQFILNDKFIAVCFSYFGYALIQFIGSSSPGGKVEINFVQSYETYGGESILLSQKNPNIGFVSDGLNGILIVDFNLLPKTKDFSPDVLLISRLRLSGWVNQITLVNDEKQLVASSIDGGQITVIDISNILKPFIVTEFTFSEKNNYSSCKTMNNQYFFLNTDKGIRGFIMNQQSLIHTDIAELIPDKAYYTPLDKNQSFKVGQNIVMNFQLIYPQNGQKIQSVYYYKDRLKQQLPSSWMSYNQEDKQLIINVNRDGLYSSQNQIKQNILVVLSIFSLNSESFIYNQNKKNGNIDNEFVETTKKESVLIYNYLKKAGYIDWKTGIVNTEILQDHILQFKIAGVQSSERLFKAVTHTLQQSYTFNPIYFNVESSLKFNINTTNSTYVSSLSNLVSITLSFYVLDDYQNKEFEVFNNKFQGVPGGAVFINLVQTFKNGLSFTITKGGTILKAEGTSSKINEFLEQKVVYWYQNPTEQQILQKDLIVPDKVFVVIVISDLINFDQQQVYMLKDVPFLKLKGLITQNDNQQIQEQFNKAYTEGIVDITHNIDIQFDRDSFKDEDQLDIIFYATFEDKSEIPPDYWLQFQQSTMRLYGTVPTSLFRETITLRIVADNNYTIYSNELELHITGVPFLYVLELLAKIISPVLFLIGLYRFKYIMYNIFFRNRNRYSDEICYINHPYRKKIPLIGQNLQIAKLLVDGLKQIASLEQTEIRKKTRANSRKLTKTLIKTSPFQSPDNQNFNYMNSSNNTNTQVKEINSPPFSQSKGLLKNSKQPMNMSQRRRSLFRDVHIKNPLQRNVKYQTNPIEENNEISIEKEQPKKIDEEIPQFQRFKYKNNLKIEVNSQFQSLPNIEDKDLNDQNEDKNEQTNNSILNQQTQNQFTERQEYHKSQNFSIQGQIKNTNINKQELPNNQNSMLLISGQISPISYQFNFNQQEQQATPDKITFNFNYKTQEKDFIIQDNNFIFNNNLTQNENTTPILKPQTKTTTNKIRSSSYEVKDSRNTLQLKSKDSFYRSNYLQIKSKSISQDSNTYSKKGSLENGNYDLLKIEQQSSTKNNNHFIFSQIKEEQEGKDISQEMGNGQLSIQANRISPQKNFGGYLTPNTELSQNWGQDTTRCIPFQRQQNITPICEEFKKEINLLRIILKKNQKQRTVFEVKYLDENGCVNMENVISDMIQQNITFVIKMKRYQAADYILELKNKDSILYNYIKSLISRHLLSLDKQSSILYNILKSYAESNFSYSTNDWYKAYAEIHAEQENDVHGFQISFPRISINSQLIQRIIRSLMLNEPNNIDEQQQSCYDEEIPNSTQRRAPSMIFHQSSITQQNYPNQYSQSYITYSRNYSNSGFNQPLIEEVIAADILGLITKSPSFRFPSVGESLHIRGHQVDSVEAFLVTKSKKNFCSKLREIFSLDYHRYGSSQNIKLPSWMNFYQKQNLIFLEGTPSSHDIEEILIRIYNTQRYIIKEYILKITNEFNLLETEEVKQSKQKQIDQPNQQKRISEAKKIVGEDKLYPLYLENNRSTKQSSISSNKNNLYSIQNKNGQFKYTKSIINIQEPINEPLSSPSSLSQISIHQQNKNQNLFDDDNPFSSELTTNRIPQISETHRFIQDINTFSINNIHWTQSLKKPFQENKFVNYKNKEQKNSEDDDTT